MVEEEQVALCHPARSCPRHVFVPLEVQYHIQVGRAAQDFATFLVDLQEAVQLLQRSRESDHGYRSLYELGHGRHSPFQGRSGCSFLEAISSSASWSRDSTKKRCTAPTWSSFDSTLARLFSRHASGAPSVPVGPSRFSAFQPSRSSNFFMTAAASLFPSLESAYTPTC